MPGVILGIRALKNEPQNFDIEMNGRESATRSGQIADSVLIAVGVGLALVTEELITNWVSEALQSEFVTMFRADRLFKNLTD